MDEKPEWENQLDAVASDWWHSLDNIHLPQWLDDLIPAMPIDESNENDSGSAFDEYCNSLALLKSYYKSWIEGVHSRWLADPNDWVNAYNWLERHPVLWTRRDNEKTLRWNTDNGLSSAWVTVFKRDGEPTVMIEHGPHHGELVYHSHDTRTEALESSMEAAYISLAKSFHQFYDKDGNARCENTTCGTFSRINPCVKHEKLNDELREREDDPNWVNLVDELWAKFDNDDENGDTND